MIVISPHNDDLLIGFFSLIKKGQIKYAYFLELESDMKEEEAKKFCKDTGIEIVDQVRFSQLLVEGIPVIIPSPESNHPTHKNIRGWLVMNYEIPLNNIYFYSTDMKEFWIRLLSKEEQGHKRALLDSYFPLEKDLWASDNKYFLFEGVIKCCG